MTTTAVAEQALPPAMASASTASPAQDVERAESPSADIAIHPADVHTLTIEAELGHEIALRDDNDSIIGSASVASFTTSLSEGDLEYRKLHGRTYQTTQTTEYWAPEYWAPNDDQQNEGLDIIHNALLMLLDDKLYPVPIDDPPERVLDTSTCTDVETITLGIKCGALSDTQHFFPDTRSEGRHSRSAHHLARRRFSLQGSRERLLGTLLDFVPDTGAPFPKVGVVRRLRVSKSLYRNLSAAALRLLFESRTKITVVCYEPWRVLDVGGQRARDDANTALFRNLGPSAGRVYFWEAQSPELHGDIYEPKPSTRKLTGD